MMSNNLGSIGEEKVAEYIVDTLGYKIVETNVKCSIYGEIDIVAFSKNSYIFIEVKSRSSDYFMNITDTIDKRKKHALKNAALYYIQKNNLQNYKHRIDLATYAKNTDNINLYQDILN